MNDNDENRLLTRSEASAFLAKHGYRVSAATLAKMACLGHGPLMTTFGRAVLYHPTNLLDWAATRSKLRANTSSDGIAISPSPEIKVNKRSHPHSLLKKGS